MKTAVGSEILTPTLDSVDKHTNNCNEILDIYGVIGAETEYLWFNARPLDMTMVLPRPPFFPTPDPVSNPWEYPAIPKRSCGTAANLEGSKTGHCDPVSSDRAKQSRLNKRKFNDDSSVHDKPPVKRLSPYFNTPKQRKDDRRRVLKLSVQKLRHIEDPEHYLRRSVLINNVVRRVQQELTEEKQKQNCAMFAGTGTLYKWRAACDRDCSNKNYLSANETYLMEDPLVNEKAEKITDDMTDALIDSLEANYSQSPPCSAISNNESIQERRDKQIYAEMDTVFNNLIRALGET